MKRFICVDLLQIHARASFYLVRFKGDSRSEFEKLIDQFENEPKFQRSIQGLVYWMDTIGKNGALDRYFRYEGGKVKAIPVERSQLRLYGYHLNEQFMIWAGGGKKTTATYEEDPILEFQVNVVRQTGDQLKERIKKGLVLIENEEMRGNLEFEIEI